MSCEQWLKCGWTVMDGVRAFIFMDAVQPLLGPMHTLWPIDSQKN